MIVWILPQVSFGIWDGNEEGKNGKDLWVFGMEITSFFLGILYTSMNKNILRDFASNLSLNYTRFGSLYLLLMNKGLCTFIVFIEV